MEFIGSKTKEEIDDFLKTRIESLGLSTRIENALANASIRTIGGILRKDGSSLFEVDGIGAKGVDEIKQVLSKSFDVIVTNKGGQYDYLQFTPKYNELDSLPISVIYKAQTEDDWEREHNMKKEEIDFIRSKSKEEIDDYLKTRVDSLGFSKRVENSLIRESVRTIGGIIRKSGESLLEIDGIGSKGVEEIKKELSKMFDVKINGKDFKFVPKYLELVNSHSNEPIKEQTEEDRVKEENKKKEIQIIEEKYFEKQEEKEFIFQTKIVSLGIDPAVETILFKNNIFTVGDLLDQTIEDFREKYFLNEEEINSIIDIFNYLILKNKQIEEGQEELRTKAFELMGYLPRILDKKQSLITKENLKINPRDLNIFKLFRDGLTLDQIGKENNITRERARQIIIKILDKIGLNHEEERVRIHLKRDELKPKKVIKEKKWGAGQFDFCISCNTIEFPHSKHGLCEKCDGAFSGERRDKIILENDNKCNICDIVREEAIDKYQHDLFITKEQDVLCKKCFLENTGKKLGSYRNYTWSRFYEKCKSCETQSLPYHRNGLCVDCFGYITNQEREKIIEMSGNKCSSCGINRTDSEIKYNKDLGINKEGKVLCSGCHLEYLRNINNNKWKMFYK